MAVKLGVEITNLNRIVKKLDYRLIKPSVDRAVTKTADAGVGPLRSLVGISSGTLIRSLNSTGVSNRGRGKSTGGPTSGLSAAYVRGVWYGRFPDRGTRYIKRRGWSVKARTQIKPAADANLRTAGNEIAREWGKI